MTSLSRIQKHRELKTWHFDYDNKDGVDYQIFGRLIPADANFWSKGLVEALDGDEQPADLDAFAYGSVPDDEDDSPVNLGRRSLINDFISTGHQAKDTWYDRRVITKDHILHRAVDKLQLRNPIARIAVQRPLEGAHIHIDHEHQQCYNESYAGGDTLNEVFTEKGTWKKFIIPIHDFNKQNVFMCGNKSVGQLMSGAILSFPAGVPHWTANFSTEDRYTLMVTGEYDPKYFKEHYNFENDQSTIHQMIEIVE